MKSLKLRISIISGAVVLMVMGVLAGNSFQSAAKAKYKYYDTTLNPSEYVYYYDQSKKEKQGIAYDASIKGNILRISGAVTKGRYLMDNSKKVKFMGEKTRKYTITKKTKYYFGNDEDFGKISKGKFSRYLRKGSKGLLSFGIALKVRSGKVVGAYLYS